MSLTLFMFGPGVPLVLGWMRYRTMGRNGVDAITLSVGSLSLLWLASVFLFHDAIGQDYTNLRFIVINANFVALLAAAVTSFSRPSPARWYAGGGCFLTALVWAYVGAVSAAV